MLIFKINNYFGMNFFCNNANSDKSVFFTNSFKEREKKSILCAKMFHFIDSQWGFVIKISKKPLSKV